MKNLQKKSKTELITIVKNLQNEFLNYQTKVKRIIQKKNEQNAAQKAQVGRLFSTLNDVNEQLKKFVTNVVDK